MNEFVEQNNNLYPPKFLSTEENLDIGKGYSYRPHFFHHTLSLKVLSSSENPIIKVTVRCMFLTIQLLSIQNF